ncbi:MAG: hypothetical protein ABI255_07410 [Microbacteriaceae bacterium]
MKASPQEQKELLRLQAVDNRLQQLEHVAGKLPQQAQLNALAPEVSELKSRLLARTGELEDANTELKRIESDVTVVENRIARDTARVEQTASVKDIQALETELAALRGRRSDLEDIELTVMQRIEDLEVGQAELVAERERLDAEVHELDEAMAVEKAKLDAQLSALAADRAAIASGIGEDLLALYERQRARYGTGAALLQRGVSLGSNVKLTESDLADIRRAADDDVVLDPDSSCILVRTEESGL